MSILIIVGGILVAAIVLPALLFLVDWYLNYLEAAMRWIGNKLGR